MNARYDRGQWLSNTPFATRAISKRAPLDATLPTETVSTIPVVLLAIDYEITSHVPKHSIPFMCEQNNKVVVLTNVKQHSLPDAKCLQITDISSSYDASVTEMPWPTGAPSNQKVYFDRWYVLRNWMNQTNTQHVLAVDSDVLMTLNITKFVSSNVLELSKHELWLVYNPPRSSQPFALLTYRALTNITSFWNRMFQPDIWTSEFVGAGSPNDMIAMGHYSHIAVGKPYPCWGYGPGHAAGTCTSGYGYTKVLERLVELDVRASYAPGTLTVGPGGTAQFPEGIIDNNYRHDPIQQYEMLGVAEKQKQLRFWKGQAQIKLRSQWWMSAWGYILEDDTEACVEYHLGHIRNKSSCSCEDWCCAKCIPDEMASVDTLTVWSLWRNDMNTYLIPHLRFYLEYWKAERLFLNVGYDDQGEILSLTQILDAFCGQPQKSESVHKHILVGASLSQRRCASGQEIIALTYRGDHPHPSKWGPFKRKLMSVYLRHHDLTPKKMYVDCDEFFVPAFGDVASARRLDSFNYHMVMIKPHRSRRDWSKAFEWVDQPYYYRLRATQPNYTSLYPFYNGDGNEPLTKLDRRSHFGPFSEHDALRNVSKTLPGVYRDVLRSTHTMYHMSVPSEEIFVSVKSFDQTTTAGSREGDARKHFNDFYLAPEKDFLVFEENYLHAFFQGLSSEKTG